MSPEPIPEALRAGLARWVAGALGLHFPADRWPDLELGLRAAAAELGWANPRQYAENLLAAPPSRAQIQALAAHLTIGETYFFREPAAFEALARHVLPPLLEARRKEGRRRLRLWSAGCCTGEESYSLAILVRELLPDLADWQVTILATDINGAFLRKAVEGVYGEWSFRGARAGFRERWFRVEGPARHRLAPEVRAMVAFAQLNLAEDHYLSLATETHAMDVIFCRNVLMYFTPEQARRATGQFHRALTDEGWLVVSPTEAAPDLFGEFALRNHADAILYQKCAGRAVANARPSAAIEPAVWPAHRWEEGGMPDLREETAGPADAAGHCNEPARPPAPSMYERAAAAYDRGHYDEAVDYLLAPAAGPVRDARSFSLLARASANRGRLGDALAWCERWIAAEKLDPAGHYLHAMISLEQGDEPRAQVALQRAVYLDPAFAPAHFSLGNLARNRGRQAEARRHFRNALGLLDRMPPGNILPESDGLTAGRLVETIRALESVEVAS